VPRAYLEVFRGQPYHTKLSGRRELAEAIANPQNPLTARVMVNRIWYWLFARGIVPTVDNFGRLGEKPTHPELLDYLATRFIDTGWSIRALHKEIVLTRAYAAASGQNELDAVKDPKNEFYWRFDRRRLSAEELRDTILLVSGKLDPVPGGPHPFGPRGGYVLTQHNPFVADLEKFGTNKRSVYMLQQRFRPNPYLDLFDGPDANGATAARVSNNTALQALYMLNDSFVETHSSALAARIALAEETAPARIRLAYRLLYGRAPAPAESQLASQFLAHYRESTADLSTEERTRAAWTGLMRVLLSSNEFFYVD